MNSANSVATSPEQSRSRLQSGLAFCTDPIDALPLRIFEILFTGSFLIWMGRCFLYWRDWLTSAGFHLTSDELVSMGYPTPFPLLPGWAVPLLALAILAGAAGVIFNRHRRWALGLLFASAVYVQGVDFMAAFTLNKLFVGIYGILLVCPGYVRGADGRLMVSAVAVRVIQATLILQYFAAGLAKSTHGDWLEANDVLYGHVQGVYRTDMAAWMLRTMPIWGWTIFQHVSLLFELGAPLLFCVRGLRRVAFVVGLGFHLMIAVLMKDLIYFSLQMWTFYVLFVAATEWRTVGAVCGRWLRGIASRMETAESPAKS